MDTKNTITSNLEKDESFGIIPLKNNMNSWQVFIVQHNAGHFGFPKGHKIGEHETAKAAAERELQEETGLTVKSYYLPDTIQDNYECISHGKHVDKTVTFFIANVQGEIILDPNEIKSGNWEI